MRKKKITFVISALNPGGAERVISILANELVIKYDISIITFNKVEPFYPIHKDIKLLTCKEKSSLSNTIYDSIKLNYFLFKKISSYLKQEKTDLVISFMPKANILSTLGARKNNIPIIISERIFPKKNKSARVINIFRKLTYKKANFLVVQTKEIKDHFTSMMLKEKIRILPNPIDFELTKSREFNTNKDNIILNVGRLTNQKAQDVLIQAFANINNDNWKLIIIGEGENRELYEKLIHDLDLKGKVVLLGTTKDMASHYNSAKIFAFTSIFEGYPNALIEAMHFGLPCISTDCPTGPSELIENQKNGFLIPMGDQRELENKLSELISDEDLRETLGRKAITSVKQFESDTVTSKWDSLISQLI